MLRLLLAGLFLFAGGPGAHAQQQTFATASTTTQLLSALGAALRGASGGGSPPAAGTAPAATIAVLANLTVGSASFASVPGRVPATTRYKLTIRGAASDSPAPPPLLDTSRRSGLVVPAGPSQSLLLSSLSMLNGCGEVLTWDDTVYMLTSNVYLFGGKDNSTQNRQFQDLVIYVPETELYVLMYLAVIQSSSFAAVTTGMPSYFLPPVNFKAQAANMSRYRMTVLSDQRPTSASKNVHLHATSDPALPRSVRAALLPPALCNGTVLPSRSPLLSHDPLAKKFPLNVAYDSDSLVSGLTEAGIYTQNTILTQNTGPIPALFLTTSLVLGGENGQYYPVTLRAECILFGPVIQGAGAYQQRTVTLNMGTQANVVQLAVRGRLLISHLVLTGLIKQRLGAQSVVPSGSSYETALPLWNVNMPSRKRTFVYMDQVTLTLPQSDFAALLSAAIRGAAWQTGASTTRPLMQGITPFKLLRGFAPRANSTRVLLAAYEGWGVSATNLTLVPSTPLASNYTLPDL